MRKKDDVEMKGKMMDINKAISVLTGVSIRGRHGPIRAYVLARARRLRPGRSFVFSAKSQKISKKECHSIYASVFKEIVDKQLPFVIRTNPNNGVFAIFRKEDFKNV
jgi:hypothetical protein